MIFTVSCCQKCVCMMADPGELTTCVKADTLGLPSDHMLNCAIFYVVMELVYLLVVSDKSCIYGTMISTVTNGSQWTLVFKYIPQHLFLFWGIKHLTLMACL